MLPAEKQNADFPAAKRSVAIDSVGTDGEQRTPLKRRQLRVSEKRTYVRFLPQHFLPISFVRQLAEPCDSSVLTQAKGFFTFRTSPVGVA